LTKLTPLRGRTATTPAAADIQPPRSTRKKPAFSISERMVVFGVRVVTRIEEHATSAGRFRFRQDSHVQVVECLDETRARDELADHAARVAAAEIGA